MDDKSQNDLLQLLSKRRKLVELRNKIARDGTKKNESPQSIHDYDSDDSVKDKNYEPDYDSSCSHISQSPDTEIRKRKISKVKRQIFTPVKTKYNESDALISLEDLLGPTEKRNIFTTEMLQCEDEEVEITAHQSSNQCFTVAMVHQCNSPDFSAKVTASTIQIHQDSPHIMSAMNLDEISTFKEPSDSTTELLTVPLEYHCNRPDVSADILDKDNSFTIPQDYQQSVSDMSWNGITSNQIVTGNIMMVDRNGTIYLDNDVNPETSETSNSVNQQSEFTHKKGRKRNKNTLAWKRVSAKLARVKGSPYYSSVAKKHPEVEARLLKDPCSCKLKCYEKIPHETRLTIFNQFWRTTNSWEQRRQFVARTVTKKIKGMMKTTGNFDTDRRKYTYTYSLVHNLVSIPVCKVMYLKTLCIGEKFVKVSLDKQLEGGMTIPDLRGKHAPANKTPDIIITSIMDHINSYPFYESHYSREKTARKFLGPDLNIPIMYKQYKELMAERNVPSELVAKEWIYRHIFNDKFNFSFKLPSVDTCDDCDALIMKIAEATTESKRVELNKQKEVHENLAEERYKLKRQDKQEAGASQNKIIVLMVDMQKCMATPNLTNSKSFYLRKLWTLNLTIFEPIRNVASNMIWSENTGARGGNEVASCLLRWAEENHAQLSDTEQLTVWSDNCGGQNRNTMVIMAYMWLLLKFPHIKLINHKFMLKGHTHMEVDQIHSQIEKKKKQIKTMQIAIPRDWSQFIRTCGGKRRFEVYDMHMINFKDFTSLNKKNGPFIIRKKNKNGEDFKISDCVWLQVRKDNPGILFYKYSFADEFSEVSFLRNASRELKVPDQLPLVRTTEKPISQAKYNDLLKLLEWVPEEFHSFYKNLPYDEREADFPETD